MAKKHRVRWTLFAAGALCLLIVAVVIVALPYAVRYELVHRLQDYGIAATIGNVDADIFTGRVSLDHVRGHGPGGDGFRIGHLTVNVDYGPLRHKHIEIARLRLSNTRIPIRRTADRGVTILGLPLASLSKRRSGSADWGFGISRARLTNVILRYRQPKQGHQRPVDQNVNVTRAKAGHFASWQPGKTTPVTLHLAIDKGRLSLAGHISPLGPQHKAHFKLKAKQFPLPALAPLARRDGWRRLGGTFDAEQTLDFKYGPNQGLDLTLNGQSTGRNVQAVTSGGTRLASRRLAWSGQTRIRLSHGTDQPGHIRANGTLKLASIKVRRPGRLDFSQAGTRWQGQAKVELGAKTTRVTTHGDLAADKSRLNRGGWLSISSKHESLHGALNLIFTANRPVIHTAGRIKAHSLSLAVQNTVSFDTGTLNWHGQTSTAVAGDGTHIHTDGSLTSHQLTFNVPKIMHVVADRIDWQGKMRMLSAALFSRVADGDFIAQNLHVEIPGLPTHMTADRFSFDGHYASQPNAGHNKLQLRVSGNTASRNLAVMNTAIHAPWLDAMQLQASGIDINSLDSIALKKISASGLRVLGDTDTDSALMRAVSMTVRRFSLSDMAHYSLADLTIGDANIHARRDASGLGVISQFMHSVSGQGGAGSNSGSRKPGRTRSTFAIGHLHLSGPRLAFADTTTTPPVRITGHNLDFNLNHLDTARPQQSASYRLSADLGAYGHLDSRGTIAPLAPDGPNMKLRAWLRSLALIPMSGYLNAAMSRKIATGVIDGTLNLSAKHGNLNGLLKATLANLRLANDQTQKTEIAYGISMNTALKLLRGQDDLINFKTKILGDITKPYFSIDNLIREAVLAGLRTALFSDFSPLGLLNKAKTQFLNLFRSVEDYPAFFQPGMHYVRPEDRRYMQLLARAIDAHPGWTLHITGRTVPADAAKMGLDGTAPSVRRLLLKQLARERENAIRDYLTARGANPAQIKSGSPTVTDKPGARPAVTFSLAK